MSDFYASLGINSAATAEQIKQGYRKEALKWHPDKNPNNAEAAKKRFQEISHAYEVLSDVNRRHDYDRMRKYGGIRHPTNSGTNSGVPSAPGPFRRSSQKTTSTSSTYRTPDDAQQQYGDTSPFYYGLGRTRDPFDIFREFFRDAGIDNVMGNAFLIDIGPGGGASGSRSGLPSRASAGRFSTVSANSPVHVSSTRVSTQFVNGKSITVKSVVENGIETKSTYENGQLVSQTSTSRVSAPSIS